MISLWIDDIYIRISNKVFVLMKSNLFSSKINEWMTFKHLLLNFRTRIFSFLCQSLVKKVVLQGLLPNTGAFCYWFFCNLFHKLLKECIKIPYPWKSKEIFVKEARFSIKFFKESNPTWVIASQLFKKLLHWFSCQPLYLWNSRVRFSKEAIFWRPCTKDSIPASVRFSHLYCKMAISFNLLPTKY